MGALIANGRAVDGIVALLIFEMIGLILVRKHSRSQLRPVEIIVSLGAGVGLLLALRAALIGADWPYIAGFLLLALVCHLSDLRFRWCARRG